MLRGLTTVNHFATDVPAAVRWYAEVFGVEPYFEKEFAGQIAYVEFRIGDYQAEFGILDARYAPHPVSGAPAGAMTYWAVDDVEAAFERLLSLGASEHSKPTEQGPGFITASVVDPFGNVLGIMFNQHYLDMVELLKK
ncbi:glyoxalase/bleomycin resistance/dioxygenase family protein [Nocardia uniformis]|uniref:Glyoxalase/bleomycin resistance/dioxygenase family protein n=1 Tax=Nocardia uniformis TaxID=53432 RepID=A0A849CH46_9NOCA|nr:VOC family protein [Nocardia uniformis]NNH75209.1 glyoxalase/bleomycin resistance/dioxygenase family protein [Nocardia uniformis]